MAATAAISCCIEHKSSSMSPAALQISIRAYDETTDLKKADEFEKTCEAGSSGKKVSLFTDLLGDPLGRVRHYPAFHMLVAETIPEKKMVGVIRAGLKEVVVQSTSNVHSKRSSGGGYIMATSGSSSSSASETAAVNAAKEDGEELVRVSSDGEVPKLGATADNASPATASASATAYTTTTSTTPANLDNNAAAALTRPAEPAFVGIAYILGLRVSSKYRRLGIGEQLVKRMEEWCFSHGAEYAYVATEEGNEASVSLFTRKLGYEAFRRPAILLQAIGAGGGWWWRRWRRHRVRVEKLSPEAAAQMYAAYFRRWEFYPRDIGAVVGANSKASGGTWLAREEVVEGGGGSSSWAAASIWKCNEIYELEVRGAGRLLRGAAAIARSLSNYSCCLLPPPPPPIGRPFGIQLLYGVACSGPRGPHLARHLARHATSLARRDGCAVIAAELSPQDPLLRRLLPRAALHRDLWLLKRLAGGGGELSSTAAVDDPPSLFLDPRDF